MSEQNYQDPYAQQPQQSADPYAQQPQQFGNAPYGQPSANQPQPYGQPGAVGAYGATQEYPKAQTTFVLGIVGIFVPVCAWIAWYMGGKAKKEIAAGAPYTFEGNLKTGYLLGKVFGILGIIGAVLSVIWMILVVVAVMNGAGNS